MERLFEWDENKAAANVLKHGIDFGLTAEVFDDPFCIFEQDRIENGEARWRVLGMAAANRLLLVACTLHQHEDGAEIVRIISARRADKKERKLYECGEA